MIAGQFIGLLTAQGLDLGVGTEALSEVIGAFIFLGLAYIDAKYPNTFSFLENAPVNAVETEEDLINGEYEEDVYE